MQYVTFNLGGDLYGLPILAIREIARTLKLTPIYGVGKEIRGLANLRGRILPVIDLGVHLGLPRKAITTETRFLILKATLDLSTEALNLGLKAGPEPVGLLVDSIADVVEAGENEVDAPPVHAEGGTATHVMGVVRLDRGLLTLLNTESMLALYDRRGVAA